MESMHVYPRTFRAKTDIQELSLCEASYYIFIPSDAQNLLGILLTFGFRILGIFLSIPPAMEMFGSKE